MGVAESDGARSSFQIGFFRFLIITFMELSRFKIHAFNRNFTISKKLYKKVLRSLHNDVIFISVVTNEFHTDYKF